MALISRYHTEAAGNTIFAANYNGEFDNIINNGLIPSGIVADGAANVTAMRATSSPGAVGAETLPVSLSDEIRQIHYVIKTLSGGAQWYDVSGGALGTVTPLGATTDNAVARFNGTSGKSIQNSGLIVDDTNNLTGIVNVTSTGFITTSGNISTTGSGTITSAGTLTASGALAVSGATNLNGNVTIGDAAGDSLTITAATSISVSSAFANASHLARTMPSGSASGDIAISSAVGSSFDRTATSYADITNLSVTLTTNGRPVFVGLMSDGTSNTGNLSAFKTNANSASAVGLGIKFLRGSTAIHEATSDLSFPADTSTSHTINLPASSMHVIDVVAAGTYTYKAQLKSNQTDSTARVTAGVILVAYEL